MSVQVREDIVFDVPDRPFAIHWPCALSDDELLELSRLNPEIRLEVSAQGDLIFMPPAGGESSRRNADVVSQLFAWAKRDGTGVVYDSSGGFRLPNGALRSPDASWVSREKLEPLTPEQREKFLTLCPDFVVELLSPSDSLKVTQQKMQEYRDNGTQLGWLIDAKEKRIYVYPTFRSLFCKNWEYSFPVPDAQMLSSHGSG
ncbi:hypothetical protein BH24DEI2_BH24DEI2_28030 [soil metagenome]